VNLQCNVIIVSLYKISAHLKCVACEIQSALNKCCNVAILMLTAFHKVQSICNNCCTPSLPLAWQVNESLLLSYSSLCLGSFVVTYLRGIFTIVVLVL